jgi:hypothetical protein
LPSVAVTIGGKASDGIAKVLRGLPRQMSGGSGRLTLGCRCLEAGDEAAFLAQLS